MMKNKATAKLEGLPPIYYINLNDHLDRRAYMENLFSEWGIENSIRIPAYDGRKSNLSEYLIGKYPSNVKSHEVGCTLSHLRAIHEWYNSSDSEYVIIGEDDLNLDPVKYWPFNWKNVVENLPQDWDIIQLAIINPDQVIMNLHQHLYRDFSTAAYLIKRDYAKKLLDSSVIGDKYRLDHQFYPTADRLIYNLGKTYAMPLFLYNIDLESTIHIEHDLLQTTCYKCIMKFWKKTGCNITDYSSLFHYNQIGFKRFLYKRSVWWRVISKWIFQPDKYYLISKCYIRRK